MKRKSVRKHAVTRKPRNHSQTNTRSISIIVAILLLALLCYVFIKAASTTHVLGTSTGPHFLADQEDTQHSDRPENHPVENHPPENQTEQKSSNSDKHSSQDNAEPSDNNSDNKANPPEQHSDSTHVDCVGPDGKHFTTSFHDCQEFNQNMGRQTFKFTPLSPTQLNERAADSQITPVNQPEPTESVTHQTIKTTQGNLEVQIEGNKGEFNLETAGAHVEIKKEDNGSIKITAHKADGTEVQLQTNALDQINQSLKEKNVKVSTTSASGFAIQSAGVQAETNFPVSINALTKTLAVTTPSGTSDVTTLPNEAVQNVLRQNILTNILSTARATTANAAAANNTIVLTAFNNQPVYAIQGVSGKKLFGIFPVAYRKTVYVSVQNGQTLQTQEGVFNKILEAFSL